MVGDMRRCQPLRAREAEGRGSKRPGRCVERASLGSTLWVPLLRRSSQMTFQSSSCVAVVAERRGQEVREPGFITPQGKPFSALESCCYLGMADLTSQQCIGPSI